MVKNAIKKIRPAKVAKDVKETIMNEETQREPASVKKNENEANRNWKQDMVAENAYITSLLGIVNFPKREDSDDEGKYFFKLNSQKTMIFRLCPSRCYHGQEQAENAT